jgi:uncharacterized membrane protein (UPF0127 family)
MENWQSQMDRVVESARLLSSFNVIDVEFVNDKVLEVYVAITRQERAMGLSTIPYLDLDGMMFFYDKPSFVPFTMADMGFDLDIGWYDEKGKLIKIERVEAGNTAPVFCPKPFSYVIETMAGSLPETDLRLKNV